MPELDPLSVWEAECRLLEAHATAAACRDLQDQEALQDVRDAQASQELQVCPATQASHLSSHASL